MCVCGCVDVVCDLSTLIPNLQKAEEVLNKAVALEPDNPLTHFSLVWARKLHTCTSDTHVHTHTCTHTHHTHMHTHTPHTHIHTAYTRTNALQIHSYPLPPLQSPEPGVSSGHWEGHLCNDHAISVDDSCVQSYDTVELQRWAWQSCDEVTCYQQITFLPAIICLTTFLALLSTLLHASFLPFLRYTLPRPSLLSSHSNKRLFVREERQREGRRLKGGRGKAPLLI